MENNLTEKKEKILQDVQDYSINAETLAEQNEIDIEVAELVIDAYKKGVDQYSYKFWSLQDEHKKLQVESGQVAMMALKKLCK